MKPFGEEKGPSTETLVRYEKNENDLPPDGTLNVAAPDAKCLVTK